MAQRILRVRNLTVRERKALDRLRGSAFGKDPLSTDVFAILARESEAAGLAIAEPDATFVTGDEQTLLAWLAVLQRQQPLEAIAGADLEFPLLKALRHCSGWLDRVGLRLDYRIAARVDCLWEPRGKILDGSKIGLPHFAGRTELQAKATRVLTECGTATAGHLRRVGISRHTLHAMCKQGKLDRVGRGLYAAGPSRSRKLDVGEEAKSQPIEKFSISIQ
jgi:hypothetical protein